MDGELETDEGPVMNNSRTENVSKYKAPIEMEMQRPNEFSLRATTPSMINSLTIEGQKLEVQIIQQLTVGKCFLFSVAIFTLLFLLAILIVESVLIIVLNQREVIIPQGDNLILPTPFIINFTDWSKVNKSEYCFKISRLSSFTIDHTGTTSCNSLQNCTLLLQQLQASNRLDYNFVVGGDGRIYEVMGWKCATDVQLVPYHTMINKIAFIGDYHRQKLNPVQRLAFQKFINYTTTNVFLSPSYGIVPQCCKQMHNQFGPGKHIIDFLLKMEHFKVPHCIIQSQQCSRRN